ncbi:mucin-binding protein [Limosilactobacillus mucosae]
MVSKNNYQQITKKLYVEKQHWGLRKLSIGVASVLLGTAIMAPEAVHADNKTTTLTNGMVTTSETASDQESPVSQTAENNNSVVLKTSSVAPDSTVKPSSEVQNSSAPTSNEKNEANSDPENEPTASNSSELNVNSLTELNKATGAALNTNLTQASDDSTIVKPSAPITDDSFKGQTLAGNEALIGTGKAESIQLNDDASLSISNNVLFAGDTDQQATLNFSAAGSAGSSYQIVIDKNHGIILNEQDVAKLPSAYGTTVFEETNDQYIITDHFTNNGGTISQDIFLKPTDPNIVFSYGKTITNISLVKNDDPNSIKTLAVSVIAPEQDLNEVDLDAGNLVYNNRNVEYSGSIYLLKLGTMSASLLNQNFEELIVQLPDLSYFTPSTLTLQKYFSDKSVSVPVVDGKATFERDQLDELLDDHTYANFKLTLQGKFNVPQDQFKDSKYDVSENSKFGLNLIYKNGYGSINGLIVLKNVTVIDDQTRLTADVALKSGQNFDALFADNDYSRDKISEDTIEVYQQHSNDNYDDVLAYDCWIRNNLGNQDLKNVKLHIEVPDGLNIDTLNIGGEGNVNVKLQDGTSKTLTAADFKPDDDVYLGQNIVAVDVEIPTLSSSQYFPIRLKNSDEKPISKTYLNGTPTKIGDLLTGKMTISADDYDPITVDNIYVRLIDHNIKHGIDLGIDQDQESTTPGVLNAGRLSYTAKDYNSNYLMDLKSPIVYIQIPENASIQDLSKIYVNVNNGDLKPKAISLLTVDGHEFLKVDLSNCDLIERELNIQVPYSNIPDIQTSSKNSAFLVVSDSVSDQLLDHKANHFDPNSTDPDDEPFKSLVQHEGIDPVDTAYVNYINYRENWEILVPEGMTSATMTKGNDNAGPSLDSTQDDHANQANFFNLYGTIINATDTPITNAVQVINIPDTSDGHSQFNPQLTGPIHIIDANTNSNLDASAKVTYSESVANLSASAKGIPSNQLTADQVTDWSKIKSITIRMDVLKRTSARAVLTVNDPQIYDHVGKTVYMASTIFSTEKASDASDVVLKPLTIAAGSAASAKLTVKGQATVKTIVHYKDDKGDDHYIELPDKAKTYNELQDTMNRSDFLQSASDLTDADKALLPTENIDGTAVRMVLDYANPTIKNSSEKYLDHYQNGTAAFGQKVKYDFDQDSVVFEGAVPIQVTDTKKVTETIHYVYENGPKAGQKAADDVTKSVEFNRVGFKNPFTGEVKWAENTDNKNFAAVDSPQITGYLASQAQIAAQNVTQDSNNIEKTVKYRSQQQKMTVKYIDDDAAGKVLHTDSLTGLSNETADYTTANEINALTGQHYILVSDDTKGQKPVYDDDADKDQVFNVHVKHATHSISDSRTVNETVHYQAADGSQVPNDHLAKANFNRTGIHDEVTGADHWNAWNISSHNFDAVPTPVKTGYTPDVQTVPAETVTPASDDIRKVVTYTPDAQKLSVKFVDDTTGRVLKTVTKTGVTNADAKYNTKSDIDSYKSQHYVLVSDSSNGANLVFDNDDSADQAYEVHLKHGTHQIDEHHTIKQTVHYTVTDHTSVPDDHTVSVQFDRDGYNDEVTGDDHWNAWKQGNTQTFAEVPTPKKAGYTPDKSSVPAAVVHPLDQNQTINVTYAPDTQKVTVTFIDDADHGKTLKTVTKTGPTNSSTGYATGNDINAYKGQHYVLVSDQTHGQNIVFDADTNADQHYEVHLKHGTHQINDHRTINETVHYKMADGTGAPADHTAKIEFSRDGFNDEVTGADHWNAWTPSATQQFDAVQSPEVKGYTPDTDQITAVTVNPDSQSIDRTVTYSPDVQKLDVTFIDDTTGKTLKAVAKNGVTNADAKYSTKSDIQNFESQHYVLVSDSSKGVELAFDNDDAADQHYAVHLKHATHAIKEHHAVNETVHYAAADGSKVSADHTANVQFDRDGFNDEVTGIDHWNAWTPSATQKFAEVLTPAKTGYTPDLPSVNAKTVGPTDGNIKVTVTYAPDTQNLDVKFIDDSDNGKVLKTVAKSGATNADAGYNTQSDIDSYKSQHYVLVSDSSKGQALKFDDQTGTDQHYVVHLKHNTHAIKEHHTIKQTVHYTAADHTSVPDDHVVSVQFDRDGFNDEVTGIDHWNAWTPSATQKFAEVLTPAKTGYTPDLPSVNAKTVGPTDGNIKVTVTYAPDTQNLDVKFIDDSDNGKVLKTVAKSGATNADAGYNTQSDIDSYKSQHYVLVSDSSKGQALKFDDQTGTDQHYVVHLKHNTHAIKEHHTIKQTVHYTAADHTSVPDDHVVSVQFDRDGFNDEVTGIDHWNAWTPSATQKFAEVLTPAKTGYTPDLPSVNAKTVGPTDGNIKVTVTYAPDTQNLDVKFIDDSDNGKVLKTITKSGATNTDAGYSTKSDIQNFEGQHYVLVSDSSKGQALKFDDQTGTDQHYEVHLKHAMHAINEHHAVNETVHYAAADGSKVPADHTANVQFDRDGFNDEVAGIDHWNAWQQGNTQTFAEVPTPVKKGYTPDVQLVDAVTVNPDSQSIKRTVTYTPDAQKLDVTFIDDTTGKTLKTVVKKGVTNADAKYSTQPDIQNYESHHYVLVSDSSKGAELVFDDDDAADQHYAVHLKHATHAINEHHVINETIHYKMSDGTKAPADYQAKAMSFSRDGFNDEVTGFDHWNAWTPKAEQTFGKVVSPVVAGYTPDIDQINAQTVKPTDTDLEFTVTYAPNVQLAHVKYIDDTNHKVLTQDDLSGRTGETSGYHTADRIVEFKGQHYDLVSDNYPADGITFDNNDRVDQNYEVHFKHGTRTDEQDVQVPRTIKYVYQNGQQAQPDHSDALKFHETKVVDLVDGHTVSDDWTPAQDFETVATPAIQGYTPDRTEIANAGIKHDHSAIAETVTYNPDAQKAVVKYIDDTTGEQLEAKDLAGVSDQSTGYNTKETIDGYINQHYVLVSDDTDGQTVVFDHDDHQNQSYEVHLKHGTEPANESRTKKITVHYQYADGLARSGKAADDQTAANLTFKRTGTHDLVTGKTAWNAWDHSAQTFAEIDSPVIGGYTPDQVKINNVSVTADSPEMTEKTVVYNADAQKLSVDFIDDTTGKTLKTVNKIGHSDESAGYDTKSDIQDFISKHYDLISDQTNGENLVFDHDDKSDQTFEVHFKHGTQDASDSCTKTLIVHYQYADKNKAADDQQSAPLTFTRKGTKDLVTGDTTWQAWDQPSQTFATVKSPTIPGYTPDQTAIDGVAVNADSPAQTEKTVTYTANAQKATVKYVDDNDANKVLKTVPLSGKTNAKSDYTTAQDIQAYKDLGYVLVSDDTKGAEIVFDNDDKHDQNFAVQLTHGTVTVTPDNPGQPGTPINPGKGSAHYPDGTDKAGLTDTVNRNITYKMSDGSKAPAAVNDQLSYTATKVIDKVTGEVIKTDWSQNQDFKDIPSPEQTGYTPDKTVVSNKDVAHDAADITEVVTYTADDQKATVTYIDDTTGKTLKTTPLSGKTKAKSGYTTAKDIQAYKDLGYVLVSDSTNGAEIVFDNDDKHDQPFEVHLKHGTVTVTPDKPGQSGTPGEPINPSDPNSPVYPPATARENLIKAATQTIHYVGVGDETPADKVQTKEDAFTRTVTIDKVTGKVLSTSDWQGSNTFGTEDTPVIDGYHADKKTAGGLTATVENPDVAETVTYAPNGKIVPVDPNGTPIPGAGTPSYQNDPNDPSKVVPNEPTPTVPGYTPETPSVTPEDPTKDTPVPYTKNETPTTPANPMNPSKPITPGMPIKSSDPSKVVPNEPRPEVPGYTPSTPDVMPADSVEPLHSQSPAVPDQTTPTNQPAESSAASEAKSATLPQTGNDANEATAAAGLGMASFSALLTLLGTHKKHRED